MGGVISCLTFKIMKINATEKELIKIGIEPKDAKDLSENRINLHKSEVTNSVLINYLKNDNLIMLHKFIGDRKVFYNIPASYVMLD
jgi:hypothetical protein